MNNISFNHILKITPKRGGTVVQKKNINYSGLLVHLLKKSYPRTNNLVWNRKNNLQACHRGHLISFYIIKCVMKYCNLTNNDLQWKWDGELYTNDMINVVFWKQYYTDCKGLWICKDLKRQWNIFDSHQPKWSATSTLE